MPVRLQSAVVDCAEASVDKPPRNGRDNNAAARPRCSVRAPAAPKREEGSGLLEASGCRQDGERPPLMREGSGGDARRQRHRAPNKLMPARGRRWGDPATRRPGDPATRRPGDPATRRPGDPATRRPGDPATRRPGDPATRRPGDPATRRPGDPATRRPGDPATIILSGQSVVVVNPHRDMSPGAVHEPRTAVVTSVQTLCNRPVMAISHASGGGSGARARPPGISMPAFRICTGIPHPSKDPVRLRAHGPPEG